MKRIICLLLACLWLSGCSKEAISEETAVTEPTQAIAATEPQEAAAALAQLLQQRLEQTADAAIYEVELTPDQAASFASGQYFLLFGGEDDLYLPFYFSSSVCLEGNRLRAQYNGKVPYMVSQGGDCHIPSVVEGETRDGKTQYTFEVSTMDNSFTNSQDYSIHLICDRESGQIIHCETLPYGQTPPEDLFSGTQPQPQIAPLDRFFFSLGGHYQAQRDEQGALLPINQWETSGVTMREWNGAHGLQMAYGRLSTVTAPEAVGDVYMVFLWKDQQGNSYGSELLPVTVVDAPAVEKPPLPSLQVQWDQGNRILLYQENQVSVYLCKASNWGNLGYQVELHNESDRTVNLQVSNVLWNGKYNGDVNQNLYADPGQWDAPFTPWAYPGAVALGEMTRVQSLSFDLIVSASDSAESMLEQNVQVTLRNSASVLAVDHNEDDWRLTDPWGEFQAAPNQSLMDTDGVYAALVSMGAKGSTPYCIIRLENTGNITQKIKVLGVRIQGENVGKERLVTLKPNTVSYVRMQLDEGIAPIGRVEVGLELLGDQTWCLVN